jgi:hypothetical protein
MNNNNMNNNMKLRFITNIYDPDQPDFFDKFLSKNITGDIRNNMISLIKEYLKEFVIGEPRIINKINPKAIEKKKIVGLYSLPSTRKEAIDFFAFSGIKKKNRKIKNNNNDDFVYDINDLEYDEDMLKTIVSYEPDIVDPGDSIEECMLSKINEMLN